MSRLARIFTALWLVLGLAATALAQGLKIETPSVAKIGGVYKVTKIQKKGGDHFVVEFTSTQKTGKFDVLVLESDHLHVAVEEGKELRLSAEVLKEGKKRTEVAQVLVFLPHGATHVPVWLLSRNAPNRDLRGSRYIEMHAPTSDYLIL